MSECIWNIIVHCINFVLAILMAESGHQQQSSWKYPTTGWRNEDLSLVFKRRSEQFQKAFRIYTGNLDDGTQADFSHHRSNLLVSHPSPLFPAFHSPTWRTKFP